jgi:hypothetical protein
MGNEESTSNDGLFSPLEGLHALEARDARSVAKYMQSDRCENVFVMVRFDFPDKPSRRLGFGDTFALISISHHIGDAAWLSWEPVRTPSLRGSSLGGVS